MPKQMAFAKTEVLESDAWREIVFEDLVPGDIMRTSNSPGKSYNITGYPRCRENSDNWEITCQERR